MNQYSVRESVKTHVNQYGARESVQCAWICTKHVNQYNKRESVQSSKDDTEFQFGLNESLINIVTWHSYVCLFHLNYFHDTDDQ